VKKPIITITIVILCFFSNTKECKSMGAPGASLWSSGQFEMPDKIKNTKTLSELKPFLDDVTSDNTRTAAVRRLGEIEGDKAIDLLVKNFAQESIYYNVKFEIARTLGRIGTDKAKSALMDLLRDYWAKMPGLRVTVNGKVGVYVERDNEFRSVVPVILESLYKWSSDNDVYKFAKTIAESNDMKIYYGGDIGIPAWEIYLNGDMLKKGIVKEKDSTIYWLDLENDLAKKGKAYSEENGILKMNAVRKILSEKISETSMNSLINEFTKEQEKEPKDNGLTARYLELRDKIDNLQYYLKSKKEAKEKLDAYKKQVAEQLKKEKTTTRDPNG
jgi:hypothetical protein